MPKLTTAGCALGCGDEVLPGRFFLAHGDGVTLSTEDRARIAGLASAATPGDVLPAPGPSAVAPVAVPLGFGDELLLTVGVGEGLDEPVGDVLGLALWLVPADPEAAGPPPEGLVCLQDGVLAVPECPE